MALGMRGRRPRRDARRRRRVRSAPRRRIRDRRSERAHQHRDGQRSRGAHPTRQFGEFVAFARADDGEVACSRASPAMRCARSALSQWQRAANSASARAVAAANSLRKAGGKPGLVASASRASASSPKRSNARHRAPARSSASRLPGSAMTASRWPIFRQRRRQPGRNPRPTGDGGLGDGVAGPPRNRSVRLRSARANGRAQRPPPPPGRRRAPAGSPAAPRRRWPELRQARGAPAPRGRRVRRRGRFRPRPALPAAGRNKDRRGPARSPLRRALPRRPVARRRESAHDPRLADVERRRPFGEGCEGSHGFSVALATQSSFFHRRFTVNARLRS